MAHKKDEHTVIFLRMTASQMRELAGHAPEIARELRHIADQLEAEAADIEARARPVYKGRHGREARPEGC
jgi:hypothetical protein